MKHFLTLPLCHSVTLLRDGDKDKVRCNIDSQVSPVTSIRRLIAFVSLMAILLAALSPASSTTLFWAIVVPLLLFFAILPVKQVECRSEESAVTDFLCFQEIPSRAPPATAPLN